MILRLEDMVSFKANWEPKSDNLRQMALELNLGLDSFVFVDDNPAKGNNDIGRFKALGPIDNFAVIAEKGSIGSSGTDSYHDRFIIVCCIVAVSVGARRPES